MLEEFKKRLLEGDLPTYIADDLTKKVEQERLYKLKEIEQSKLEGKYIMYGLKQPKDSIPYAVADGFIHQYEQETGIHRARPVAGTLEELRKEGEDSNE